MEGSAAFDRDLWEAARVLLWMGIVAVILLLLWASGGKDRGGKEGED